MSLNNPIIQVVFTSVLISGNKLLQQQQKISKKLCEALEIMILQKSKYILSENCVKSKRKKKKIVFVLTRFYNNQRKFVFNKTLIVTIFLF